jgi:hypothetical protein
MTTREERLCAVSIDCVHVSHSIAVRVNTEKADGYYRMRTSGVSTSSMS